MHTVASKTALWKRVRRISGQLDAVERALVADAECSAVLQIVAAVRGATDGLMWEVLEEHIQLHLVDPLTRSTVPDNEQTDSVIELLRRYLK
jgi:DNA-binding FrmR family transcriptional regulator